MNRIHEQSVDAQGLNVAETPMLIFAQPGLPARGTASGFRRFRGRGAAVNAVAAAVAGILYGASGGAYAQAAPPAAAPTDAATSDETTLETIVVTGTTSKRTLLNASVNITLVTDADLAQKSPRSTVDVLELVPGIFVEGTAGAVSNNYSVRGLPGGSQRFVQLQVDGLPVIYGGGGADEYFSYDITTERVEAIQGGTSGVLSVNGAGATINFISRKMNFNEAEGLGKLSGTSYGDKRADLYYTAPIPVLGKDVAFSVGGYIDSNHGPRDNPFTFPTYHLKGAIEKRFGDSGFVRFTYKRWDEHDAYYADMPYKNVNGHIEGVPGLNTQSGNLVGPGFATITMPTYCADAACTTSRFRSISLSNGIHETGNEYRLDFNVPFNDSWSAFAKARYLQSNWDFNGLFPGSGVGTAGLASAVDYLTPGVSPIDSLLTAGAAAFPGTTRFGIKNLSTGQIFTAASLAATGLLNGNGLLQQTWLNHDNHWLQDWGADFGVRFNLSSAGWSNSLTVGVMYYKVDNFVDQSGTSHLINDVVNGSNIYDVVALNNAGGVVGTLSNNGLIGYGDWGVGIREDNLKSISGYFNDELALLDSRLHVDFGLRYESVSNTHKDGNAAAVNPPVPAGVGGLLQTVPNAWNGTYTIGKEKTNKPTSWTVGANYTLTPTFSVYGRLAQGNQTNGGDPETDITLYEAGLRYGGNGFLASATFFRTVFNDNFYNFIDPVNPALRGGFEADSTTNGIDISVDYRPTYEPLRALRINFIGTYQQPKLANVRINGVQSPTYSGNTPERTPRTLYAVTPAYELPHGIGEIYARYKYIGPVYADSGDGLGLPSYGVVSLGGNFNLSSKLNLNVSVDNISDQLGLTEGNPRQGITQSVVNGYFYGRGIIGTNAQVSLNYRF